MRNVAKLVALDMGALYSGTHKYRWWSHLVAFLIVLIAFLNGDAATPLAGAITGTSVGILMMRLPVLIDMAWNSCTRCCLSAAERLSPVTTYLAYSSC